MLAPVKKIKIEENLFEKFISPAMNFLPELPELKSGCNRILGFTFEKELRSLIYYHLEEHDSGCHLLQDLQDNDFAKAHISKDAVKKSTFFEAINSRGLEQLQILFAKLQKIAGQSISDQYRALGELIAVDGSLIQCCLSMIWADYRKESNKAKIHLGFSVNRAIPSQLAITKGNANELHYVDSLVKPGETGIFDRNYQCYRDFDHWQETFRLFVCRIKENSIKTVYMKNKVSEESNVFYDAVVWLGEKGVNQTKISVRVVGYEVDGIRYWVATNRYELPAETIAFIYKLRWTVENFFKWWKKHLKVYHNLVRSEYGLMVQLYAGLITYLLLAIHCQNHHSERVSIQRVRELRIAIENQFRRILLEKSIQIRDPISQERLDAKC